MYRKLGMYLLAALLLLLPVSAAFGGKASAASSSRIAVIKQLSGDVQVQKSGGSKQFKAFAKLSLNQGGQADHGEQGIGGAAVRERDVGGRQVHGRGERDADLLEAVGQKRAR
ncbi:hypothetical protein [Cohnella rhizosphaerae]|uniref:Uncharacterized protein n=1 Tax=Cohnella rhizosphaerae TaxID=1457232 RepID=A0A9X4KW21_9BACL|nr:hypothetical protein [Cohnella rhizosphaerae]MDG0811773.1 hypothetical protein [Cohnella rhizosphaerae]